MMRLLLSPDRRRAVWRHQLDNVAGTEYEGWIDCTDMDDPAFDDFMGEWDEDDNV